VVAIGGVSVEGSAPRSEKIWKRGEEGAWPNVRKQTGMTKHEKEEKKI